MSVIRDWRVRRKQRKASHEAAMQKLADEYDAGLREGDPDVLETSRDYYDNDGGSTIFEIGFAAYLIVLVVTVVALIGLFTLIEKLTSG